jgi:hypothetical protein
MRDRQALGGLASSFVAYMDEHEGFFVDLFTGLLFVATIEAHDTR